MKWSNRYAAFIFNAWFLNLMLWGGGFASCVFITTQAARAQIQAVTQHAVSGTVEWKAQSTLGLVKIMGTRGAVSGKVVLAPDGTASGTLDCDLTPMTTANDLRDEHMHTKYLDTKKWPTATLKLDPVVAKDKFDWSGQLTLKGETKNVHGTAWLTGDDLRAEFSIKLADFPAVGVPAWKDITVAGDVTVEVKAKVGK